MSSTTFLYTLYALANGTTVCHPKVLFLPVAQAFSAFETSLLSVLSDEIPMLLQ